MMQPSGAPRVDLLASTHEIREIRQRLLNTTFKVVRGKDTELAVEFLHQPTIEDSNIDIRFSAEENYLGTRQLNLSFHRKHPEMTLQVLEDLRILLDNGRQPVTNKEKDTFSFKGIRLDTEYRFIIDEGDGRGDVPRPVVPRGGPPTLSEPDAKFPPRQESRLTEIPSGGELVHKT